MKKHVFRILPFLFVLSLSIVTFETLKRDKGDNVSLAGIIELAYAQSEEDPPDGEICRKEVCTVTIGVAPYQQTYSGHYWGCGSGVGECKHSECWVACDAGPG